MPAAVMIPAPACAHQLPDPPHTHTHQGALLPLQLSYCPALPLLGLLPQGGHLSCVALVGCLCLRRRLVRPRLQGFLLPAGGGWLRGTNQ